MVVQSNELSILRQLELPYLGFFLGLRVNELVMEQTWNAGFNGVRESHGYVIQHLIDSDRTITELARRMGVTQQAASKGVAELIHLGLAEAVSEKDRRAKRIRLAQRGRNCVRLGRRLRAKLEKELIRSAGKKNYENAKATIVNCLELLGGVERIRSRRIRAPR
jgi:DNA-binding MarR family transcriptional regulator